MLQSIRQRRRQMFVFNSQNMLSMERTLLESKESIIKRCEKSRKLFEERTFSDYYIRSIKRNPETTPRISGALDFVPGETENKDEFLKKDENGNYVRQDVSAMWHGWCLLVKCLPTNTKLAFELMKTKPLQQEGPNEGYDPSTGHKDEIEFHY